VYLTAESNHTAYQQLVDEFTSDDQSPVQCVCPTIPAVPDKADDAIANLLQASQSERAAVAIFTLVRTR
jgi:putative heme degradation protein